MNKPLDETQWTQIYRCACGRDIDLGTAPSKCDQCDRPIGTAVQHDLSMTVTVGNLSGSTIQNVLSNKEARDLIGKELGHFKILELVGSGGMGQVYRALDTSLQRYVAVKVLRNSDKSPATALANEHLLQEAVAQARVNHANVVTIYYVGRHEGNAFLAMELVSDATLASRIKDGPLPYGNVSSIALQVADALRDSHNMGIVHGDIKPNNVLLGLNGFAKLSDFGMSRILDKEDQSKTVGGTPNYLAPELLDGGQPSIQSDMYALGVTLFEMTFGRLPVQMSGSSVVAWRDAHVKSVIQLPSPLPANIPVKWINILKRLLNRDPSQRFESYDELIHELRAVQPSASTPARAFPRAIAWFFDLLIIVLLMAPLAILAEAMSSVFEEPFPFAQTLMSSLALLPLALYFVILIWWKQSVGRHLMSIRVVNQFGLPPSRTVLITREFFRMSAICLGITMAIFLGSNSVISSVVQAFVFVILVASCVFAIFNRKRRTLHDFVFKTRVIIDTPDR